ncbi:MAG: PEP-CTERM sorting domain-containing protein [Planctomycetales bacterium]|nr:PEP-CTERM sorting domain-containing protein [Planctomycetales bacterium]
MFKMSFLRTAFRVFVFCSVSQAALGGVIVEVGNASIAAGGTGFVDVWISSTGTDSLSSAAYEFKITGSATNGALEFSSSQLASEQGEPDYVFSPHIDPLNFFAARDTVDPTRLLGGDSIASPGPTAITLGTTKQLLARLELVHNSGSPLNAIGDQFTISLINTNPLTPSDPLYDPLADSSLFLDDNFTALSIAPLSFSGSGTISITSAAVPEPGTFAALGLAAFAGGVRHLRRRRTASAAQNTNEA